MAGHFYGTKSKKMHYWHFLEASNFQKQPCPFLAFHGTPKKALLLLETFRNDKFSDLWAKQIIGCFGASFRSF